jgi:membrane fusion protein
MTEALFRQQACQALASSHLGAVRIAPMPATRVIVATAVSVGLLLVGLLIGAEFTRKARVPGLVVPVAGLLTLQAPSTGAIAKRHVNEGDFVQAGQLLFELTTDHAASQGHTAALLSQSLAQRESTLWAERQSRREAIEQRTRALMDRERALALEAQHAQQQLERITQLAREGFVAQSQVQARQEETLELQARAQSVRRNETAMRRELQSVTAERQAQQTHLKTEMAQSDRAMAALSQDRTEMEARRTWRITASQAGRITAVHVHLGSAVQAGQALATWVPQPDASTPTALQVDLFAPSRTSGFVKPGQQVMLRYAAYSHAKYGMGRGTVVAVARTPTNPKDLPAGHQDALQSSAQSNEPLYRIQVRLDEPGVHAHGQQLEIRPGMVLEAHIQQDRRALWEWLFEPLLALRALS